MGRGMTWRQEEARRRVEVALIDLYHAKPITGRRASKYAFAAPHIVALQQQLDRITTMWGVVSADMLYTEFVSLGALALRALEQIEPHD